MRWLIVAGLAACAPLFGDWVPYEPRATAIHVAKGEAIRRAVVALEQLRIDVEIVDGASGVLISRGFEVPGEGFARFRFHVSVDDDGTLRIDARCQTYNSGNRRWDRDCDPSRRPAWFTNAIAYIVDQVEHAP